MKDLIYPFLKKKSGEGVEFFFLAESIDYRFMKMLTLFITWNWFKGTYLVVFKTAKYTCFAQQHNPLIRIERLSYAKSCNVSVHMYLLVYKAGFCSGQKTVLLSELEQNFSLFLFLCPHLKPFPTKPRDEAWTEIAANHIMQQFKERKEK